MLLQSKYLFHPLQLHGAVYAFVEYIIYCLVEMLQVVGSMVGGRLGGL